MSLHIYLLFCIGYLQLVIKMSSFQSAQETHFYTHTDPGLLNDTSCCTYNKIIVNSIHALIPLYTLPTKCTTYMKYSDCARSIFISKILVLFNTYRRAGLIVRISTIASPAWSIFEFLHQGVREEVGETWRVTKEGYFRSLYMYASIIYNNYTYSVIRTVISNIQRANGIVVTQVLYTINKCG